MVYSIEWEVYPLSGWWYLFRKYHHAYPHQLINLHWFYTVIYIFRRVKGRRNHLGVNRDHHRDMTYWKILCRTRNNHLVWIGHRFKAVNEDGLQRNWPGALHDEFMEYLTILRTKKWNNLIETNPKIEIGHICERLHPDALKIKVESDLALGKQKN